MQQLTNLRVDDTGEVAEDHKDGDEAHGGGGDQGQQGVEAGGRQGPAMTIISVSPVTSANLTPSPASDRVIVGVRAGTRGRGGRGCQGPGTGARLS